MQTNISLLSALPTLDSQSEDWANYYSLATKQLGSDAAKSLFSKAWAKWGDGVAGSKADTVKVREMTGLPLDETFFQGLQSTGDSVIGTFGGLFSTVATGTKIVMFASIGIGALLIGGIAYRIVTASATEIGTVAGVAAKVAV